MHICFVTTVVVSVTSLVCGSRVNYTFDADCCVFLDCRLQAASLSCLIDLAIIYACRFVGLGYKAVRIEYRGCAGISKCR